jgi:carbonic anhydrase/acetyltransferase-like protein (isoleucine patch superfamily)
MNLRTKIKISDRGIYYLLKKIYMAIRNFTIPAPIFIARPLWYLVAMIRTLYYWGISTFWVTPLYKGLCKKVGKNFKAGSHLPFVIGKGLIHLGDNVRIFGKVNFIFGSIKDEIPEIHIGDRTSIGHEVTFDISGKLEIGEHCLVASGVTIQDCAGHSIQAEERSASKPPQEKDVRPIKIGNNVWIGDGVYIMPGSTIGNDCVISAKTVVSRNIPENYLIYQQPYKAVQIRKISKIV